MIADPTPESPSVLPGARIELTIENVRRIEHAELSLALGSRTIVVGRNNSGRRLFSTCSRGRFGRSLALSGKNFASSM